VDLLGFRLVGLWVVEISVDWRSWTEDTGQTDAEVSKGETSNGAQFWDLPDLRSRNGANIASFG
jgi:hypothetical protein